MKLYQYKGGGYDGCIWEWNFFLINEKNEFVDIFSSGISGIKTKEKAFELVNETIKDCENVFEYDLKKESDISEFEKENVSQNVGFVCDAVNTSLKKEIMFFHCSICGEKVFPINNEDYPSYFHDENNYSGNGGVGIVYHSVLCEGCYFHRCEDCGMILEEKDSSLCEFCQEEKEEQDND